jgi:hypothetical protein
MACSRAMTPSLRCSAGIAGPPVLDDVLKRLLAVPSPLPQVAEDVGVAPPWLVTLRAHGTGRVRISPGSPRLPAAAGSSSTSWQQRRASSRSASIPHWTPESSQCAPHPDRHPDQSRFQDPTVLSRTRDSGFIARGYRWRWREVLDARACKRLAFLESATFGNESPAPNDRGRKGCDRCPAGHRLGAIPGHPQDHQNQAMAAHRDGCHRRVGVH